MFQLQRGTPSIMESTSKSDQESSSPIRGPKRPIVPITCRRLATGTACTTLTAATNNAPASTKSEDLIIVGTIDSVEYRGITAIITVTDEGHSALLLGKDEKYVMMDDRWYGSRPTCSSTPEDKTTDNESYPWEIGFPSGMMPDTQKASEKKEEIEANRKEVVKEARKTEEKEDKEKENKEKEEKEGKKTEEKEETDSDKEMDDSVVLPTQKSYPDKGKFSFKSKAKNTREQWMQLEMDFTSGKMPDTQKASEKKEDIEASRKEVVKEIRKTKEKEDKKTEEKEEKDWDKEMVDSKNNQKKEEKARKKQEKAELKLKNDKLQEAAKVLGKEAELWYPHMFIDRGLVKVMRKPNHFTLLLFSLGNLSHDQPGVWDSHGWGGRHRRLIHPGELDQADLQGRV